MTRTPGSITTALASPATAAALDATEDGGIVVVATSDQKIVTARYTVRGVLDPGFGTKGIAYSTIGGAARAAAVACLPDGRTITVGTRDDSIAVLRYCLDGKPDATFGTKGATFTKMGDAAEAVGVAIAPDGGITVLATVTAGDRTDIGLVRYTADGRLDDGFGQRGTVAAGLRDPGSAAAIALRPSGEAVLTGATQPPGAGQPTLVLRQYLTSGLPDTGFGTRGQVLRADVGTLATGLLLVLDTAGHIVIAGTDTDRMTVSRYTSNGTPDTSFGNRGTAAVAIPGKATASSVAVQDDGRILVVGTVNGRIVVARHALNGTLDPGYGTRGTATTTFGGINDTVAGIVLAGADDAVIVGTSDDRIALAKITVYGVPDTAFGS